MAVKLRLQRYGSKKRPFYRVVASDSRMKRDGRYLEILGTYDPTNEPAEINIDEAKTLKWMAVGAKPTDTVKNLLKVSGISLNKKQENK